MPQAVSMKMLTVVSALLCVGCQYYPWLCYEPLEAGCGASPCRTYEARAANVERFAGPDGRCFVAQVGTCGDLRFTQFGDGLVSTSE
jgi:hypothetical protein